MINEFDREKDILRIIESLDISPTMFKNATDKYEAITSFLEDCGIEANMYPQGSFAVGTVVRPNAKDPSAAYDLDVICQVVGKRSDYAPSELRQKIEDALRSSKVYGGKLSVYKECFTVEYADINGISFTIDIVPAVDEIDENKARLLSKSSYPELLDTAVAIPKHNGERNYSWLTNNPKGLREWFDEINEPFLTASRNAFRKQLFERNQHIYCSVEEIPSALERSSLQRVIQILKHHRNVYYANLRNGDDLKPISAILTVVIAKIARRYRPDCSPFELLQWVLNELTIYSKLQNVSFDEFSRMHENYNVFTRPNEKWYISNPANPEDNLADKWNQNSQIPAYFFRWIKVAQADLIWSLEKDEQSFRTAIENGLGNQVVFSVLGNKYRREKDPEPIASSGAAKPYRHL